MSLPKPQLLCKPLPNGGPMTLPVQSLPLRPLRDRILDALLHRIGKEQVIAEVTATGFVLIDESKALYHPRDDHTKSVFAASVRGQTDQFMLKFQKPADAGP